MIFVTGGTGFVGTHFLGYCAEKNIPVRALKRSSSKILLPQNLSEKIDWVEGDVTDMDSLLNGMKGCDRVVHAAAVVSFLPKERKKIFEVNAGGTANVVQAALISGIKKLIYISSVSVLENTQNGQLIDESNAWNEPSTFSMYAHSKWMAEREVWRAMAEGLNAIILNPSLIIGSGDWKNNSPEFFLKVWKGLPVYTKGGSGIIPVDDLVELILLFLGNDIVNDRFLVNAENWSFKDFFTEIATALGKKPPRFNLPNVMTEVVWMEEFLRTAIMPGAPFLTKETARAAQRKSFYNNNKIVKATGFRFRSVKDYIHQVAEEFLEEVRKQ